MATRIGALVNMFNLQGDNETLLETVVAEMLDDINTRGKS
jgi:hypothetical protein